MSTLLSLAADVYVITNRPDLVAETKVAIRKAIRKFHGADTFKRDLRTQRVDMKVLTPTEPNQYRWAIDLATFTRWRRFKSVNYPAGLIPPYNQIPAPMRDIAYGVNRTNNFVEISPDNLYDGYGYERLNYFMVVGNTVNVKSGWYIDLLEFAYYQWPEIPASDSTTLGSWIATDYPDAIVEEASGQVFKMIGKDEEFNRFNALFLENLSILRASDLGENT